MKNNAFKQTALVGLCLLLGTSFELFAAGYGSGSGGDLLGNFKKGFNILMTLVSMIGGFLAVVWLIEGGGHFRSGQSDQGWRSIIAALFVGGAAAIVELMFGVFGQSFSLKAE